MLIHAGEYECIINVQMYIKQIEKLKNSLLKLFLNYIRETLFGELIGSFSRKFLYFMHSYRLKIRYVCLEYNIQFTCLTNNYYYICIVQIAQLRCLTDSFK